MSGYHRFAVPVHAVDMMKHVDNGNNQNSSSKWYSRIQNFFQRYFSTLKPERNEQEIRQSTDIESGSTLSDHENTLSNSDSSSTRFRYAPRSLAERILVSIRIKNKLDSSRIIRIPFNSAYRYILIALLLALTTLLTPQLLPRWLGFHWAAPQDLCQAPDVKLEVLRSRVRAEARVDEATRFLVQQELNLRCMNVSAASFYHGASGSPPRFAWPRECNSEVAKVSLRERHCVQQETNVCAAVGGFLGFLTSLGGNCVRQVGPEVCVNSTDTDRADGLLELEQLRAGGEVPDGEPVNTTAKGVAETRAEPIITTANKRAQEIVGRVIMQIDIAADAFIIYSMIAIAVGVPLVIYRREKGSMVVGTAFGLTKATFILIFVVALTIFDMASLIVKETDFARLFSNFMEDPCYVNSDFSTERVRLIADVCNNISGISTQSTIVTQRMDSIYYDVRLFGYCKDDNRPLTEHPRLSTFDALRTAYRNGTLSNPGTCNATRLNEMTSVVPKDNTPKWKALLSSGVLAQLLLKFILTSWLIHVFAYIQPMVLHNGKVEVWGLHEADRLAPDEEDAVRSFSRDKHLLSLIIFSILLILEVILITYSVITSINEVQYIDVNGGPPPVHANETVDVRCSVDLFA